MSTETQVSAPGPLRVSERAIGPSPVPGVAAADMPRERLARHGVEALRDHELLAILLGTGYRGRNVLEVARGLLDDHPTEALAGMGLVQLERLKGVGAAKASLLVAAFEFSRRALGRGLGPRPVIARPQDALPVLADIRDQRREFFLSLHLNARNQLLQKEVVSIGSLSASIVHPREVFLSAVTCSAASVILAHNHPSGDVSPSRDDLDLTRRLTRAGEIMGIDVLDHIIISAVDFVSLKERGLM